MDRAAKLCVRTELQTTSLSQVKAWIHTQAIALWVHCSGKKHRGHDLAPLTLWSGGKSPKPQHTR